MADLELTTVNLEAVEIFSEGGPYHGQGSPPEGDTITAADIERYATQSREVVDELRALDAANKLSHTAEQKLAASMVDDAEMPALGWLHNFRTTERDGLRKLVCDIKDVPKTFAKLIEKRAFPRRSVELGRVEAQDGSGGVWDSVVTGLSWLGARAPAVRNLADIYALYAEGDVIWNPDDGMEAQRRTLSDTLNPSPPGGQEEMDRYWVNDFSPTAALVCDGNTGDYYVVPIDAGQPAPADQWVPAEQAWVQAATAYEEALKDRAPAVDSSVEMADPTTTTLDDEQITAVATAFGIEEADDGKRRELVLAKFSELAPVAVVEDKTDDDKDENDDPAAAADPAAEATAAAPVLMDAALEAKLEVLTAKADAGDRAARKLDQRERDDEIDARMRSGQIHPSRREFWQRKYDEIGAETAIALMDELPVNDDYKRTYGYDADGIGGDDQENFDRMYAAYAQQTGVPQRSA